MNIIVIGGGAAGLMAAGTAAEQGAQVDLFLFILEQGRVHTAVLGRHGNDIAVVIGDLQTLSQHFADRASAAAVLARDGNDRFFHPTGSLLLYRSSKAAWAAASRGVTPPDRLCGCPHR